MDRALWKKLLNEAVWWDKFNDNESLRMYQSVVTAWGMYDQRIYAQGPERVDLTNVYEQYKILATLKGTHNVQQQD
jgi:hypothetical protein